jgi:hypothetical protein
MYEPHPLNEQKQQGRCLQEAAATSRSPGHVGEARHPETDYLFLQVQTPAGRGHARKQPGR